jgi:pimeloyl-ACP methyl ester carboxylesterase
MTVQVAAEQIVVADLTFDAATCGVRGDPLVLMLHGFPQTSHTWRHQLPPLAAAGYFAVAPNQRGYAVGARPQGLDNYATGLLVEDALGMARTLGYETFHLVGHDWGGQLSWLLAAQYPSVVSSLTVLSRPHPSAFAHAMAQDAAQSERSKHHRAFLNPKTAELLLENDAARLRRALTDQGVEDSDVDAYLEVLGERPALEGALNWYRAAGSSQSALADPSIATVSVPTLYIWGDADATVGRVAADATAEHVSGPYRFEVLPAVGHFVTDQAGSKVTELLLDFLSTPGSTA